jgi:hypothetical protein
MDSIDPIIDDIREKAVKSCDALEIATSSLISLPHFMAGPFNDSISDAINLTIRGFARALDLAIQAVNGIIVFFINMYKSTYRCLFELAVRGSISAVAESVVFLQGFSNKALSEIKTAIDASVASFNSRLEDVRRALSGAGKVFGLPEIPTLAIPEADRLNNFVLPTTGIVGGLDALNSSIPTMDEIENKLTNLISIPFNELRVLVKNTTDELRFNSTILPVPPMNSIKFCDKNIDLSFLDNIKSDLRRAALIGISILLALCALLILANAFYIWISHKRFIHKVDNSLNTFKHTNANNINRDSIIDIVKFYENPILYRPIIQTSNNFKNEKNQIIYRWFWDYILFKPAIICLIIGLSGMIAVYIQIAIINGVRRDYKDVINNSISSFGNTVMDLMSSNLQETSKVSSIIIITLLNSRWFIYLNLMFFFICSNIPRKAMTS